MKKEIIIDGTASDWFEKATFILKDSPNSTLPKDLVQYAEELVENHMKRMCTPTKLPPVDFSHKYPNKQKQLEMAAYRSKMNREDERRKQEKERLRKRAHRINVFVTVSLLACFTSIVILIMSYL